MDDLNNAIRKAKDTVAGNNQHQADNYGELQRKKELREELRRNVEEAKAKPKNQTGIDNDQLNADGEWKTKKSTLYTVKELYKRESTGSPKFVGGQ